MKILFVHQNMPGQFKHLVRFLVDVRKADVVFVTRQTELRIPGVRVACYPVPRGAQPSTHPYLRRSENAVLHGQQVARIGLELLRQGWRPDVIVAHPGWGEALFLKDVFPSTPLLNYCEFYYSSHGADMGFDPNETLDIDTVCRTRIRNSHLLLSLECCDAGLSPTEWQKSRHPAPFRDKISVIFDGIETGTVKPDPTVRVALADGRILSRDVPVITYVARNLEPYRGFPQFVEALPAILARCPDAHVIIVGGDEISYGNRAPDNLSWREYMAKSVTLDPRRVHFVGRVPYQIYLSILQISSVHVYLTYPFVLSWSCLEAMAAGCTIVASDTAPVVEVIEDGVNGHLVDFFDRTALEDRVVAVLQSRAEHEAIRRTARETVLERFDLRKCLPKQIELIEGLAK